MTQTFFISDLHLDEHNIFSADRFFYFADTYASSAEAIYILGDLFEAWIGDDDKSVLAERVKATLRHLNHQGTRIYLMGGNRDFLLGKRFAKESHSQLLTDFTTINLYGQKILLSHGDALCTNDEAHMRFRKMTTNPWVRLALRILPIQARRKIAAALRSKSKQQTRMLAADIMDVTEEAVLASLQTHQSSILIHGHTHRPASVIYPLGQKSAQRIVLGSWDRQGCFLRWTDSHKRELVFF